mmetsp:Transcript_60331/g.127770  ORF Transcript_60331/g.127770 Transcript_60331/m.127770 type:complete len:241 (-) Transcript_60331:280-1002(-)
MPRAVTANRRGLVANLWRQEKRHVVEASTPLGRAMLKHMRNADSAGVHPGRLLGEKLHFWTNLDIGTPNPIPVNQFFLHDEDFPPVQQTAMSLCRAAGRKTLDIGAGSGSHVLALQQGGHDPVGLDISPDAVEVMKMRGIRNCITGSMWTLGQTISCRLSDGTNGYRCCVLSQSRSCRKLRGSACILEAAGKSFRKRLPSLARTLHSGLACNRCSSLPSSRSSFQVQAQRVGSARVLSEH